MDNKKVIQSKHIKKQAASFFVWTFSGMILAKLRGIVFVKIFSIYLGVAVYGYFYFILNNGVILSNIISFNMGSAVFRFITEEDARNDKKQSKVILSSSIILSLTFALMSNILIFSSAIFGLILFSSETYLFDIASMGLLAIVIAIDNILLEFFRSRQDKFKYFSLQTIIPYLTLTGSIIFGILLELSVFGLVLAHLLGYLILLLPIALKILIQPQMKIFDALEAKKLLSYSTPNMIVTLVGSTKSLIFNLLLKEFHGNEALGTYSVALSIVNLFALLDYIVALSYPTIILKNYDMNNHEYVRYFVNKMTRIYLVLIIVVTFVISTFAPMLVIVFSSPEFINSAELIPLLLIAYLFQSLGRLTALGALLKKRPGLASIRNVISNITHFLVIIILIPPLGALGAAISLIIFFFIGFVLNFQLSQALYRIKYDKLKFGSVAVFVILSLGIGCFIGDLHYELIYSQFGVGVVIFICLIIGFRIVRIQEIKSIFNTLIEAIPVPKKIINKISLFD